MNTTRIWFRAWGRLVSLAVLAAKAAVTVGIVGASSSTGLQSATQGRLCFTIEDSQRIRDDVLRRSPQPPQTELQNETSAAYSAASSCASSGKTAIRTMSVLRLIASGNDHQTQLTVWVYNRYPVPADLLRIALRQTATIFEHAGIRIRWLNCLAAGPQEPTDPACLPGPTSNTIVLTILGNANGGYRRSLGYAFPRNDGGKSAVVYYRRVGFMVGFAPEESAPLLGAVVAHEIGHALLPGRPHSKEGIMRPEWKLARPT